MGPSAVRRWDFVLLTDDDTIEFATPEQFAKFEPISADRLLRAA